MKSAIRLSLVILCCLGLYACPYESHVPIGSPSIPVDKRLLGRWGSKDEVYNQYTVARSSETEYRIIQRNSIGNISTFKGFLTEIKGVTFMNLYSDSTNTYYLYKIKLDAGANKLTLIPLAENLPEHFGSMDGLRSYVEKNVSFKTLYNESEKTEFEKADAATTLN